MLLRRFSEVRARTMALTATMTAEDMTVQSMPDASPAKWHLAHTTWFFATFVLARFYPSFRPNDSAYEYLFNSYYEAVGPRPARTLRGLLTRPSLDEVRDYRAAVDAAMTRLLSAEPSPAALAIATLGVHHEEQHQELLLTDIQHAFWSNPMRPAYLARPERASSAAPKLRWIRHDEGLVTMGHQGEDFAFDNETPAHRAFVERFEIASRLVTNGEYLAFIEASGYARPELWVSDGWALVESAGWNAPLYWEKKDGAWFEFTLAGSAPLDLNAPVSHVSWYEADAYARFVGARLPTEVEWELVAREQPIEGHFADQGGFVPDGTRRDSLFGGTWQWTMSPYAPYPRYRPLEGALGEYNGKFMSNQMVLRGGSCLTPRAHVRATYRNFFPPSARWQMSSMRLARWT